MTASQGQGRQCLCHSGAWNFGGLHQSSYSVDEPGILVFGQERLIELTL